MPLHKVYRNNFLAEEEPTIIELAPNFFAVKFSLMKMIPARYILDRAEEKGILRPSTVILETSSGTFALALARVCRQRDYKFVVVSDPEIETLRRRMEWLGTEVHVVTSSGADGGIQVARLNRLNQLREQHPDHFYPNQYGNPDNPASYSILARILVEAVGPLDVLVGPVGSGGSMGGTANYLRRLFPEMRSAGVDTFGSVIFGQKEGKRSLRGLGNSLMPANVQHDVFDEVHWVDAATAFYMTRRLHEDHDLYMGPTSGAAYLVARHLAQNRDRKVAVLFPDSGERYRDTVYHREWLQANGLWCSDAPDAPSEAGHPEQAVPPWAQFAWRRRSYVGVMGRPFVKEGVK